ncbi:MAG TPA: histidinol-phosphate transaminase [Candidatus Limnocylindrales bacterium]|nr:histidinol-phosphate transaminase [Candidatus Limnocylindrales bacterium]
MSAPPALAAQVYTWEPSNAAIARRYGLDPAGILRFDTNTSPTAPPFLAEGLAGPFEPPLNEYPDSAYEELVLAAADYFGVPPDEIVVGAGADEVLDLAAKAFLPPGGTAIVPLPTYAMYGVLTTQRPARILAVPRLGPEAGFALDVAAIRARLPEAQLVWLCSPNNPTGAAEPRAALQAVLEAAAALPDPPLVVLDEAYHEFTGETLLDLRGRHPELLVLRTMSKAFALPAIRVGFGIAARRTIERLERVRPPGSVATVSAHLATLGLRQPELARENARRIAAAREDFAAGLAEAGWTPRPSVTNFVLVQVGDQAAAEAAAERLLRSGIVPRTFGPANPLRGHLRLTVRSPEENARLLAAIRG